MQHNLKHKEKEVLFTVKRRRPWRRNGHRNQRRLVLETREEQQQESKSAKSDGRIFSQEFWVRSKKTKQSPQKETKEYRETVKQKKGDKRQSQTRELSKKEWKTHQGWSVAFFFFKQWSSSGQAVAESITTLATGYKVTLSAVLFHACFSSFPSLSRPPYLDHSLQLSWLVSRRILTRECPGVCLRSLHRLRH